MHMRAGQAGTAAFDFSFGRPRHRLGRFAAIAVLHAGAAWGLFQVIGGHAAGEAPAEVAMAIVTSPSVPAPAPAAPAPALEVNLRPPPPMVLPPPLEIAVEEAITLPPAPVRSAVSASAPSIAATDKAPAAATTSAVTAPASAPAAPRLVSAVEYLRPPRPVYPQISKRLRETGVVTLRVLVSAEGMPERATVHASSGSRNLDEAGRDAVMRSTFRPYREDGKPVAVYVLVPVDFSLS